MSFTESVNILKAIFLTLFTDECLIRFSSARAIEVFFFYLELNISRLQVHHFRPI